MYLIYMSCIITEGGEGGREGERGDERTGKGGQRGEKGGEGGREGEALVIWELSTNASGGMHE